MIFWFVSKFASFTIQLVPLHPGAAAPQPAAAQPAPEPAAEPFSHERYEHDEQHRVRKYIWLGTGYTYTTL